MNDDSAPTRKTLWSRFESSGINGALAFAVAIATPVAAVVGYVAKAYYDNDLAKLESNYDRKIADLQSRLNSIQRDLPGSGPEYLDVSKIFISSADIGLLPQDFRLFDLGQFRVKEPNGGNWKHYLTSELDFERSQFVEPPPLPDNAFVGLLKNSKAHMWRSPDCITYQIPNQNKAPISMQSCPSIYVQRIDRPLIRDKLQAVFGDRDNPFKEIIPDGINVDDYKGMYSNLSRFILTTTMQNVTYQMNGLGTIGRIISAQARENVLYLRLQWVQADALSPGGSMGDTEASNEKVAAPVIIDEEVFFFDRGNDGYLLKVTIPQSPQSANAHGWSQQFLAGLRILSTSPE